MTANRSNTAWLRPFAGLVALAAVLALSACGGGSGAPNNPYKPPTVVSALTVLPASVTVYPGVPASISISGGTPPYQAFSSNSAVLPVTQTVAANSIVLAPNPIASDADIAVALTIKDSGAQTVVASVTVKAAPLLGTLSVLPASPDCGTNICSGDTGSASVAARLPSGGPAVGMQIRFDVIFGAYALLSTNPATPLVQTLTVVTDSTGRATVRVQAQASASTQSAQIRATAVDGGQQLTGSFTITNRVATTEIKVVPDNATIQSTYVDECSSGFRVDYFVYGGNPPYRVSSSFPAGASLVNSTVAASGGFFEALTTGVCVDPLTFTIVDASGKQTTATLANKPGTTARPTPTPPTPAPDLSITPETISGVSCTGKTFQFALVGGTPPYNVVSSVPGTVISPAVVNTSGGTTKVSGLSNDNGTVSLTAVDSSSPQKKVSATIVCLATAPSTPPLLVTPASIGSDFCTNNTFQFTASGGTPPYAVVSSTASTGISPASIPASGGSTRITGLTTGSGTTTLSFLDSSSPQQSVTTTVNCTPTPQALTVSPSSITSQSCTGRAFQLVVTGGTPPYQLNSSVTGPLFSPPTPAAQQGTIATSGGTSSITNLLTASGDTRITIVDSNNPQFTTSATITCSGTNPSPAPLAVTPPSIDSAFCAGTVFQFAPSGGTPPYAVISSKVGTVINPASVPTSGGLTQISGLSNGTGTTTLSFVDSSSPQQTVRTTVNCAAKPPLVVTPASISSSICVGSAFAFTAAGGTPPYSVNSSTPSAIVSPLTITTAGGSTQISGLARGSGTTTLTFLDASLPQQSVTTTVNCSPDPQALQVTPAGITSDSCTGQTFQLAVTGGTPPYDVFSSLAGITLNPTSILTSGGTTSVSGLVTGVGSITIGIIDRNIPQFTTSATINCRVPEL